MFSPDAGSTSIYGLPHKARCLAAQVARDDRSRFFAGTLSLKEENEIHLIEVQEDEEITRVSVLPHPPEIWGLAPSPTEETLLFTVYSTLDAEGTALRNDASLWRLNEEESRLEEVQKLSSSEGSGDLSTTRSVHWEHGGESVTSIDDHNLRLWKVAEADVRLESTLHAGEKSKLTTGCWDPHFSKIFATTSDTTVKVWDLRSGKQTVSIDGAHAQQVRDVDFNRNRPYYMVSCGDDCKVRFWDIRGRTDTPVREMAHHSHWVWSVKYNPSHDQLVISSGTDCSVNLYNMFSISFSSLSESIATEDDEGQIGDASQKSSGATREDSLIKKFEEHEDSVYSIAWSAHDAWTFASLSYDGRVAINYVPEDTRYRILFS